MPTSCDMSVVPQFDCKPASHKLLKKSESHYVVRKATIYVIATTHLEPM